MLGIKGAPTLPILSVAERADGISICLALPPEIARHPWLCHPGQPYRRALTGRSEVIIRGQRFPMIGTVSMNCITVDITPLATSAAGLPPVGELVTLIGGPAENRISVEEIAYNSGTIPSVVTTQLGRNVERRYLNAN